MSPTAKDQSQQLTETSVRLEQIAVIVERISETIEGTARTQGMKEKITLAQYNIEANKQAYQQVHETINSLEDRFGKALTEAVNRLEYKIDSKFKEIQEEAEAQKSFVEKFRPLLSALSWIITGAATIILSMILTGKLHIGLTP